MERTDSQPSTGVGVDPLGIGQEAIDQPVAGPPHSCGAVDQLGHKGAVTLIERTTRKHRWKREIGVGAFRIDTHEGIDGEATSRYAGGNDDLRGARVLLSRRALRPRSTL